MKELKQSKLSQMMGGTSTTVMTQVGVSDEPTTTENEYFSEDQIGKVKPFIVEAPIDLEPLPDQPKDVETGLRLQNP
mgnify:CR=1 FL=1